MLKKLGLTSLVLAGSAVLLAGCSLINSTSQNLETVQPLSGTKTETPATVTTAPTSSNSTAVPDLEKDLNNLKLDPETFE